MIFVPLLLEAFEDIVKSMRRCANAHYGSIFILGHEKEISNKFVSEWVKIPLNDEAD